MQISLRTKILLLVSGAGAALSVSLLASLATLAHHEIDRGVRGDVRAAEGVLTDMMNERGQALLSQCRLLAQQPGPRYLLGADRKTGDETAAEYLAQIHADSLVIQDGSGHIIAAAADRGANVPAPKAGLEQALHGGVWSGVVSRSGRLVLAVAVPVLDPVSHVVLETFTAGRAIDSAVALEMKKVQGSEVAFVQNGRVVAASLQLFGTLPTPRSAPIVTNIHGRRYLAFYAPLPYALPSDEIGFVALRSYDSAMAAYYRLWTACGVILVIALFTALAAGATLAQSITRPLDSVVDAARVLRNGQWPEELPTTRGDEIGLLQSVFNEMTASLKESQSRLLALIDTDHLTGLDNHRRFQERLSQEAVRCANSNQSLSMLLVDLDRFQAFNKKYGHALGDDALRDLASILRDLAPAGAIVARFGGEEFAVLLPGIGISEAYLVAETIRVHTQESWHTEECVRDLSLSIGCAEWGSCTHQIEGLAVAAELAANRAKQLGRNRVCRFDSVPGADENTDPYHLYRFMQDGSLATIQALAAAVDAKDPYTQGHSQRVADYAVALAHYVGWPAEQIELVNTCGTLHDVGKIGVPDSILQKPGRLTPEERAIMETHPALGEMIVRKVPQLAAILPGIRNHHERWDGRGYPDQLFGKDIPALGRILAVADTFDAMTSDRPYRKGLSHEIAIEEIDKGSGTQFDPEFANAFVALMRRPLQIDQAA